MTVDRACRGSERTGGEERMNLAQRTVVTGFVLLSTLTSCLSASEGLVAGA